MEFNRKSMAWRNLPFWERVDAQIEPITESGCHIFVGGTVGKGYGIAHDNGKHRLIHRAAWERKNEPIPEGMFVLHKCDVPACCNTDHLFLGTILDNNRDRERKGRGGQLSGWAHKRPTAKLDAAKVAEIRSVLESDRSRGVGNRLAKKYGVSQGVISGIRHRDSWKHVT